MTICKQCGDDMTKSTLPTTFCVGAACRVRINLCSLTCAMAHGRSCPEDRPCPNDGGEGCRHSLSAHNEHGHCQDECSCSPDRNDCPCSSCGDFRAAGRSWAASKTHDAASCACYPCEWKRRRALEAL